MAFFHGATTRQEKSGATIAQSIPSGVVALIGIAPTGPLNIMTEVSNERDAAQFGGQVPGFSIAQALYTHFREKGGKVIVINVFDPATHVTNVAAETVTLVAGKGKSAFPYVGVMTVKKSDDTVTYVKGTDYSLDEFGNIASLNFTTIAATAQLKLTYNKPNFAGITAAVIAGTVDGTTGVRTGMKLLENAYNQFGFEPKIIIAPGFSHLTALTPDLLIWAKRLKGVAIADAPPSTTVVAAKAGRTPSGAINFNVADPFLIFVYPGQKAYDPVTNATVVKPLSPAYAAAIARTDAEEGPWRSPSNIPSYTTLGLEVELSGSPFNDNTDANDLNALGVVTMINAGTSGFRFWGNRNSSYPSNTTPDNFIPVHREAWTLSRSIQEASLAWVDAPGNLRTIDEIREMANGLIRQQIGAGGLLPDSECLFREEDNPSIQLQAGHYVFYLRLMVPLPMEHIEFIFTFDVSLLKALTASA